MVTTAVTNHIVPHLFLAPPPPFISRTLPGVKRQFHPSLRPPKRNLLIVSCLPPKSSSSSSSSSSTPRTRFNPSTKLFISGLSFRTTEESLRNAFKNFGELVEVNLVMDKIANRPRGFAFLRYATEEESKKAIEGMHGKLKYHDSSRDKDCLPQVGQWNMMNRRMVNGGTVNSWICINFARNVQDNVARSFCHDLAQMCITSGMAFNPEPILPVSGGRPDQVERVLKARFHDVMAKLQPHGKELDLLIVILPDNNGPLYGDLKRICETDLGIVSQCCLQKHVYKAIKQQYLANVALKINVKVGGRNTVLVDALTRRIPLVSDQPTIIFGADVTHPQPGEDSSPSIAAVVASQDWPEVTKYAGLVCAQAHRQELIQDLFKTWQDPVRGTVTGGMIKELLVSFHRATGQKPQRIIFYRDGVSEGQFYQVLLYELDAIRKACASLEPNYLPPVTFVVVQKRHHTRLFASNHNDRHSVDRSGNILPGTVVDSKICHPTEFDFYLCSHAGVKGTSRPAHYHVIWDENKFTADALQALTNDLCYTKKMVTTAVTNHIVPHLFLAPPPPFISRTLPGVKRQFHPSLRPPKRNLLIVSCLPPKSSSSSSSSSSTPRTRFNPSTKLFISGLSFRTTEESLRNAFKNFGELVEINLVMDKIANRPRGFAFLRYATEEESKKAIEGMHGKFLDGRVIFVEVAKLRSELRRGLKEDPMQH